jgi:hypothetical protein
MTDKYPDTLKAGTSEADFAKWVNFKLNEGMGYSKGDGPNKATAAELKVLYTRYQAWGSIGNKNIDDEIGYMRAGAWGGPDDPGRVKDRQKQADDALKKATTEGTAQKPAGGAPATPAAAAAGEVPSADTQKAINAVTDPTLAGIIADAMAGGATASKVSYWSGLGVDPEAKILGNDMTILHGYGPLPSQGADSGGTTTQTADQWLKQLYQMPDADLADLQTRLWDQGWYEGTGITDKSQIHFGSPDAATQAAYGTVLGEAARYYYARTDTEHLGIDDVIDLGSPTKGQVNKGTGQPFEKTNPADLNVALENKTRELTGHTASAGDKAAFSSSYLSEEEAARRALVGANTANQTVGVTSAPSKEAGAQEFVDANHLADRVAYGAAVRQQEFFSMLKAPV